MLNKLLEAVQFTDRRCQAIEKKIEGVPEKTEAIKSHKQYCPGIDEREYKKYF